MAKDYFKMLQALLPRGSAWNRDPDSVLSELLRGMGDELNRLDSRSNDLKVERDTRTTSELLTNHENDLGLPDECSQSEETIQERRNLAHSKLIARGQQDKGYFISLAAALGFTVDIVEFTPFWSGLGASGDECGDQTNIFYWLVQIEGSGEIIEFISGSSQSGDSLKRIPGIEALTCMIKKYKPAHTSVNFEFVGPEFSSAFNEAFDSMPSELGLTGSFNGLQFSSAFDRREGGAFSFREFNNDFNKPV